MSDFYADMAGIADEVLTEFVQGTVKLRRTTPGSPSAEAPWVPGDPDVTDYLLSATVRGVSQRFVDGTLILATDLEIMASTQGTVEFGGAAEIVPNLETDTLLIDGKTVAVIRDLSVPAAGTRVVLHFIVRG